MNITITLEDLGFFILFLLALGIGVYLAVTLKNLNGLVKEIRDLIGANRKNIDQSLANLPVITENLNEASFGVKRGVNQTEEVIEQVSANVGETMIAVHKTADSISTYSIIVTEIVKSVMDLFSKGKR
jgi:methyl-accepting chemotaxis protein